MKSILALTLLNLTALTLIAQTGNITGHVYADNKPLQLATIKLHLTPAPLQMERGAKP
ncbi:hypothetical protein [Niabella ginsengisoli]|uniref:Uncharacterized protein n=1 Tax=Niabella ginsengisoli TaxID=522298 RepID=A0ABS9SM40_9BACT|nr:hypothetical protein [Niabella ginsengisoli]MCH5599395.1 hypothetical protein [Niabella ginsengisoli]